MAPITTAELLAQVKQLIEQAKLRHAALGANNLNIYRGGKEPQYVLTANGELVYARDRRRVDLSRLTRRNLNAIRWQLNGHIQHISQ